MTASHARYFAVVLGATVLVLPGVSACDAPNRPVPAASTPQPTAAAGSSINECTEITLMTTADCTVSTGPDRGAVTQHVVNGPDGVVVTPAREAR